MTPSPSADRASARPQPSWAQRWQRFAQGAVRFFHAYANWLVSISWRRFLLLSVLLIAAVAIVHDKPPFTWTITEHSETPVRIVRPKTAPPAPPAPAAPLPGAANSPGVHIELPSDPKEIEARGFDISIGKDGVRIGPKAPADATAPASGPGPGQVDISKDGVRVVVPPGTSAREIAQAVEAARREMEQAVAQARRDAEQATRDAEQARRDAQETIDELARDLNATRTRVTRFGIGDAMLNFTLVWVIASAILKFTYKGRIQAEVKAAQATETAEAESLRRQVVEARMAAMQAQVEPHFLFNTLASIDHLIETDPARASQMQKNLIALLRASMPTMREAAGGGKAGNGVRELGREIAVIRPYLEILKVRMEERLTTEIVVPDGLLSAEFPPMMLQTLVENAIKHGLEPKAEGGHLRVAAEVVHGKLQMTVADTGLGFGKAATAGTGVGLANIRERLQLLYGNRASLTVTANQPSGTVVTITVPYKPVEEAMAA
jgi:signal transduction histidine kinase